MNRLLNFKTNAPLIPPLGMAYAAREANKALAHRKAREAEVFNEGFKTGGREA